MANSENMENSHLERIATISFSLEIETAHSTWSPLSPDHIYGAFHFAKLSETLENAYIYERDSDPRNQVKVLDKYYRQHRSYVVASIFSSVAFIESTINELFAEVVERPEGFYAKQLNPKLKKLMETAWRKGLENSASSSKIKSLSSKRFSKILKKFNLALTLNGKEGLDSSKHLFDIDTLITIRNILVHYKPQLVTCSSNIKSIPITKEFDRLDIEVLESSGKFPRNALVEEGNPYFPDKCLGCGCAEWGAESSFAFVQEFYSGMGLESKLNLDIIKASAIPVIPIHHKSL